MTRPSRLLISGYYGFANAGDEAILAGLVQGFRELAPEAQLTVLSEDPLATAAEHGVAAVPRGLTSAFSAIQDSDLLVSGGGGLLQDATSWRSPLYYLALLWLARASHVPMACIGHGIGPLRRSWVRRLTRRELSRVNLLVVRDKLSLTILQGLAVGREIHVAADLAFLLPPPGEDETAAAWAKAELPQDSRPALGIALRQPSGDSSPDLSPSLAAAIGAACQQLGLRPLLLPMQHPRDLAVAEVVAQHMPLPAQIARPRLTAREMLALVAGCDLVVALRLHALIFAAVCGRPMVAISYDPKVDGQMEELGLKAATSVAAFDAQALGDALARAWEQRTEIATSLAEPVARLRAAARRSIELALSLLPEVAP